ncbi:MAG: hypothetical protein ACT4OS_01570 [Acidimicrobiales bacterium]
MTTMADRAEPYTAEEIAYRARALAQTHPLSPRAKALVDRVVREQQTAQPTAEVGRWAGAAMLTGYCLRRVEEAVSGRDSATAPGSGEQARPAYPRPADPSPGDPGSGDGLAPPDGGSSAAAGFEPEDFDLDGLAAAARIVADELGGDGPIRHSLVDIDRTIEGLDRIIASEVAKRLDHWETELEADARAELEEYLTWWVVNGYAVRVAEMAGAAAG